MADKMFFIPFGLHKKVWSIKEQKHITPKNTKCQVWANPNERLKGYCMDFGSIIKYTTEHPVDIKDKRIKLLRFTSELYPLRDYTDFSDSVFVVACDIDDHPDGVEETLLHKLTDEQFNTLYDNLYWFFTFNYEHNFFYMEKSSSGHGMHIMFFYNFDKEDRTEENFRRCAIYTKNIFFKEVEKAIKGFTKMISEPKVFDPVYSRPFQPIFLTAKDYRYNDCSGLVPEELLDIEVQEKVIDNNHYEISDLNISGKIEAKYDVCFRIYTAIKRVTKSKEECERIWDEINKNHIINNKYDYNTRKRWFRYEAIDEKTAHVEILERFGIKIDKSIQHFHLEEDKYLGDIRETILGNITNGITLIQAGTGVGKTRCWTDLNSNILNDVLDLPYHKPILIVEPLNSIINTKYKDDVITITGSKKFPKDLSQYNMYVTNYNKLIRKNAEDKYELRSDIVEFLSNFELIVLDESHILIKDSFRCDVLIPFIDTIKLASNTSKIVLQTATPMEEEKLLPINNKILVHKPNDVDYKYIFRKVTKEKFCIQEINCLVDYYINCNRKVYVYWNNGSLRQLKELQAVVSNNSNTAIYHKRNTGSEEMERINKWHVLNSKYNKDCNDEYNYDILLSSVYFGVGNDLDDECDAAVIIIGNNTWQEDIQAIGRWRNSKNVEVCQVILPNEDLDIKEYDNYDNILKSEESKLWKLWHDKLNKDKSVIIAHKAYQINKDEDIEKLAVMKASNIYNSLIKVKIDKFKDNYYNIRVKEDLSKDLINNEDYTESNKAYWESVREIRNDIKQEIIKNKGKNIDYSLINSDSNISKWYSLYKKLHMYEIDKIIEPKYICSNSNYNILNTFVMYYKKFISNSGIDFAELYALLWYRTNYKAAETHKIDGKDIDSKMWYSMLAYIIFVKNQNILENECRIESIYYNTFKWYCKLFYEMPQELINMFFTKQTEDDKVGNTMEFFDVKEDEWDIKFSEEIHSIEDITKYIESNLNYNEKIITKIVSMCLNLKLALKQDAGKIGGKNSSNKKKCIITNKIKESRIDLLAKYNLKVGQEFESCYHLAKFVNKSNKTISEWREKNWIE